MKSSSHLQLLRKGFLAVLGFCVCVQFLASCGEATINPSEPSTDPPNLDNPFVDIFDRQWRLALMIADETGWKSPSPSTIYTVEFINDSTARGSAACQTFTAPYTASVSDKKINLIEPQPIGDDCKDDLTATYLELLRDATSYRLSDTELELYYQADLGVERTLVFREVNDRLFKVKTIKLNHGPNVNTSTTQKFKIVEVYQEGRELVVKVEYSGGCADHEFTMSQLPDDILSSPELCLIISKNDVVDECDGIVQETLRFTLDPLVISLERTENYSETEIKQLKVTDGLGQIFRIPFEF